MDDVGLYAKRLTDLSRAHEFGLWTFCHILTEIKNSRDLATQSSVIRSNAFDDLKSGPLESGPEWFDRYIIQLLQNKQNFVSDPHRALYWAIAEADIQLIKVGDQKSLEPELNGSLISLFAQSVGKMRTGSEARDTGDCFALYISDQRAEGRETVSGADIGIIIQVPSEAGPIYRSVVIQAKRATSQRRGFSDKDKKQLEVICHHKAAFYIFYNQFSVESGVCSATVKSAMAVKKELQSSASIDVLNDVWDLPSFVAFGLASRDANFAMDAESPEAALLNLFDPTRVGRNVNHVLVAILDNQRINISEVVKIEKYWKALVDQARYAVTQGYPPFYRGGEGEDYLSKATEDDISQLREADRSLLERERQSQIRAEKEAKRRRGPGIGHGRGR